MSIKKLLMILSTSLRLNKLIDLSMKEAFLDWSGGSYSSITHLAIKTVSLKLLPILKKKIKIRYIG
jgi:hypothetical protein